MVKVGPIAAIGLDRRKDDDDESEGRAVLPAACSDGRLYSQEPTDQQSMPMQ